MTEFVPVGEVLQLQRRAVAPSPHQDYRLIGVYSFGKGIFHREPQLGVELGDYRFFAVAPGDLVLSNIQAWEGAIAHASTADEGTIGTHRFLTYTAADDRIDTNWARWYFLSEPGMELIRHAAPGTTMRNRTLAIQRFEKLRIPLPPVDEQRRVAARLDSVAGIARDAGSQLDRSRVLTEALAVSICSRPEVQLDEKVARGWREVELGSVLSRSAARVAVDPAGIYPNLGIYSFGRGVFEKPPIEGHSTSATSLNGVKGGQFIYSRLFAFEGAYAFVPPEFDGYYVSNEFPTFDVDPEQVDARWLATYLRSPSRWAELGGASKGLGVRRQRVPAEAVLAYKVWLPPIERQRENLAALGELSSAEALRSGVRKRVDSLLPAALNEAFGIVS